MRYLSVCSGIEAATVAWHPLGWTPLAFAEIDAFPRAVLAHRYPHVPLHGDFTVLRHEPWIVDGDVLVGGTPCQAFSMAGLRRSLDDARGNLTLEFLRLADAIDALRARAGRPAAWVVWENVPGVFSTRDNAFGTFLGGLVGDDAAIEPHGKWADAGVAAGPTRVAAWRVLDAQHFGLAQRRRRVFVLARGGPGGWDCADALLPLLEGGGGHPAPRREAGESIAATITSGAANGSPAHGQRSGSSRDNTLIRQHNGVRRLTPRECERLQGFPDDYTLIPYRGKPAADGPRYKALGNSMAVPVMRYLGERIAAVTEVPHG